MSAAPSGGNSSETIAWGLRDDAKPYLISEVTEIFTMVKSENADYAIFGVSPVPPAQVVPNLRQRSAFGSTVTIFGHPNLLPLAWSHTCVLSNMREAREFLKTKTDVYFAHKCDTLNGSSGSAVLDDATLEVVGIHSGGKDTAESSGGWNAGTPLLETPLAEVLKSL